MMRWMVGALCGAVLAGSVSVGVVSASAPGELPLNNLPVPVDEDERGAQPAFVDNSICDAIENLVVDELETSGHPNCQ